MLVRDNQNMIKGLSGNLQYCWSVILISHQDFVSVILCLCQGHLGVTGHVSVMSGSCQSQVSNKSGLCLGQVYQSEILLSISHMQNFSPVCIFSKKYYVMFA